MIAASQSCDCIQCMKEHFQHIQNGHISDPISDPESSFMYVVEKQFSSSNSLQTCTCYINQFLIYLPAVFGA